MARMLAIAAGRMGYNIIILDPQYNAPAAQFSNHHIVASYDDDEALQSLAERCFVVTYEFENIPAASVSLLEQVSTVFPGSNALEISQDRLIEKQFINSIGMKTAAFAPVSDRKSLDTAFDKIGSSVILKTRRLGYDGKGQLGLEPDLIENLKNSIAAILETECIAEKKIDFDCEISVIGARNRNGETACYDPARNTHDNGILAQSVVPSKLPEKILQYGREQTVRLLEELDYVGVIGVEFFVTKSGDLLINEFAPRVHNSGHWTEAACLISQFDQHIRAITGQSLGSTLRHSDCHMQNLIGNSIKQIRTIASRNDTLVHDYGKAEIRQGRKMGHFTTIFHKS